MLKITRRPSLKDYNTMHIDATAGLMAEWADIDDLRQYFDGACGGADDTLTLGGGSNMLFVDGHFDGTVLRCVDTAIEMIDDTSEGPVVRVGAGAMLDSLVDYAIEHGLWGLENLSLIPGTVGGAAVQNAGAYGVEFGSVVERVTCYDMCSADEEVLAVSQLGYGYRDSIFKHSPAKGRLIIAKVEVRLSRFATPVLDYGRLAELVAPAGDSLMPEDVRRAVVELRRSKLPDPAQTGSAGSFFRNPVVGRYDFESFMHRAAEAGYAPPTVPHYPTEDGGYKLSAAWLIDKCGLKGYCHGNVATWPSQPLVIVNASGSATGREVADFARYISDSVATKWGVRLEPEVEYIVTPSKHTL